MGLRVRVKSREGAAAGMCGSCEHAQIMVDTVGFPAVFCHRPMNGLFIRRPLSECSEHEPKGRMTAHHAREIGWVLELGNKGEVGFAPPKKE